MDASMNRRLSELARGRAVRRERVPSARRVLPPLPEGREVRGAHGAYYLVETPLREAARERERGELRIPRPPWRIAGPDGGAHAVDRPLFFDLETTGFSSCPLFLAATIDVREGVARQRFARDYTEEKAVVADTIEEIAAAGTLVSYNGKSYDVPFLRTRAALHRLRFRESPDHVDLLHHCRRAWRGQLADFRLQTVEKAIGRGDRAGDVPGAEIPSLYHDFVRRGFDPRMPIVFRHNLEDALTLVRIFFLLAGEGGERRNRR
jgi:uncharacterized protein YprB with RNaseH-like and TPR domain